MTNKTILINRLVLIVLLSSVFLFQNCHTQQSTKTDLLQKVEPLKSEEKDEYDGPDKLAEFEFERTKDPALGYVPTERLLVAVEEAKSSQARAPFSVLAGTWIERGPNSDVSGLYGNPRDASNLASTAGRIRAMMVDAADATGKTVWVGGINGGLWKTTDITAATPTWILVNDYLSNLAVSSITQDPTNSSIMYFCTGESYNNSDAVRGVGVFKSTDGGSTWNFLSSTSSYVYGTKILCDYLGNIYLGTKGTGLIRSTKASGGAAWTNITPTGMVSDICDLEISSTTAAGRLHVVGGIFTTQSYRYTDIPITATSASFTAPTTAFPSYAMRAEIAVSGNTLYALPANNSRQVPTIYKSTNGGATWVATTAQPGGGIWASGQGWYALSIDINPSNANQFIIGGLDCYKTTDAGASWTKISQWYGSGAPYVHADNHKIIWYDNGNKLLFANDGGVFYSANGGTTIVDKNKGLRIKQFFSCAIHPSSLNYFLAGAQDNGTHQYNNAGLSSTIEITGGDGAFVAIDQNQPTNQFGAYVFETYRRSTDGGSNWDDINFYTGTNAVPTNLGNFINPFVYDNTQNIIYAAGDVGNVFRWTTPLTTVAGDYYASGTPTWPASASQVTLTSLNSIKISALHVSPYTSNRVYFGTAAGRVCYADGANTIASGSAGVNISTGLPAGNVSCINTGTNDNNLIVSYSNYGVNSIWVSTNAGTSWTSIEGNLPDMPVRWCIFAPGNNTKAIIATEAGVWLTQSINGASTVWTASATFPAVRTDMLQYRPLDGLIAAATHGRGLWTQTASSVLPIDNFKLKGLWTGNDVKLNWVYDDQIIGSQFDVEVSTNGIQFGKVGNVGGAITTKYDFKYSPAAASNLYYRIKVRDLSGSLKYSNVIRLYKSNTQNSEIIISNFYPNPIVDNASISYSVPDAGKTMYNIYNINGQLIWSKEEHLQYKGSYSLNQNLANLKAGSYIFTITQNDKKAKQTFIKR
jgi:trimeric autotransporter adhesin